MSANRSESPSGSSGLPATSRLGLSLFAVYTLIYLGFVLLNAFAADTMETVVVAGLNLAIVYGFGLIIVAIVMAFIYGFALRGDSESAAVDRTSAESRDGEGDTK
ncbi:DUF485 domain-containing protein [Aporhodopirellula aestuarii]|uniref:DUF485 domain-containing protein n=1 Tax=Aporhodopirellula aestuarii TaxID=2950107 RepID=A0ABT0TZJ9_9BACT|nr:DUF485 domain-containing protein [Aporhodopirellula aestuarii]MCM2370036.1 DUF485 domain-containing protein [Aporhodopirellula aestuarii]